MNSAIKAEFRKLTTVRSTYFISALALLLVCFFAFYVSGWRINNSDLHNPTTLAGDVTGAIHVVSIFAAFIAVLLVTHEYRYNTIMHTLTLSNSRSKVLVAKILVITGFAVVFTVVLGVISPLLSLLGIHAHHLNLVPQTIHYSNLIWRSLFFGWGYVMAWLLIATLVRNQVGTIIILLIAPATIEGLLGLVLKSNSVYLPFTSLDTVLGQSLNYRTTITPLRAVFIFSSYLVIGWIIAWILFLRRDAN